MQENYSEFKVPSFAQRETYLFEEATPETISVYRELNAIAEEIEECRLRNS